MMTLYQLKLLHVNVMFMGWGREGSTCSPNDMDAECICRVEKYITNVGSGVDEHLPSETLAHKHRVGEWGSVCMANGTGENS